ncbi:hypothetical protein FQZ97_645040 [compost metagenome]
MLGGNVDEVLAQLGPYVLNRREPGLAQLLAFVRNLQDPAGVANCGSCCWRSASYLLCAM